MNKFGISEYSQFDVAEISKQNVLKFFKAYSESVTCFNWKPMLGNDSSENYHSTCLEMTIYGFIRSIFKQ